MRISWLKYLAKYFVLTATMLCFCGSSYSFALADDPLNKYKIAFIFNFVKYIQGDLKRNDVCIVGDDDLYELIKSKPNTRKLDVSSGDLNNCALIYISRKASSKISGVISATGGKQIITVSDADGFISKGGIVEVYEDGGKLKFALNIKKASALKFNVNSKLIEIADKTL